MAEGAEADGDRLATYLALLRGINLGATNKLPMRDLVALFVEAGCEDVRTYIQSGNVVFRAAPGVAAALPARIAERIAERFGHRTPVVLRTADELREIVASNPFLAASEAQETLHVKFLTTEPTPSQIAALEPDRSPPDAFVVRGQEMYLRLPNGVARTKLTNAYVDRTLATTSTQRNWRTVTNLLAMVERDTGEEPAAP